MFVSFLWTTKVFQPVRAERRLIRCYTTPHSGRRAHSPARAGDRTKMGEEYASTRRPKAHSHTAHSFIGIGSSGSACRHASRHTNRSRRRPFAPIPQRSASFSSPRESRAAHLAGASGLQRQRILHAQFPAWGRNHVLPSGLRY